jgi:hypothetical protein
MNETKEYPPFWDTDAIEETSHFGKILQKNCTETFDSPSKLNDFISEVLCVSETYDANDLEHEIIKLVYLYDTERAKRDKEYVGYMNQRIESLKDDLDRALIRFVWDESIQETSEYLRELE